MTKMIDIVCCINLSMDGHTVNHVILDLVVILMIL